MDGMNMRICFDWRCVTLYLYHLSRFESCSICIIEYNSCPTEPTPGSHYEQVVNKFGKSS